MTNLFSGPTAFLWIPLAVAAFRIASRYGSPRIAHLCLIAISLSLLSQLKGAATLVPMTLLYALTLAGLGALMIRYNDVGPKRVLLWGGLLLAVSIALLFKYQYYSSLLFGEQPWVQQIGAIGWIGLSFMTFRAIDVLVVAGSRRTKVFDPVFAVSYLTFFAPFVAGPINRFDRFKEEQVKPPVPLDLQSVRAAVLRISIGVVKILFLAQIANDHSITQSVYIHQSRAETVLAFYFYYLYIYLDFSGYSDVAIGVARLFGITVPENFHYPFLASNLQDFWNRWHISLTHWCRDYVFFPLLRYLSLRAKWLSPWVASGLSIFVTFLFMGAWHGDALHWFHYGVYHGAGMTLWFAYTRVLAHFGAFASALQGSLVYRALGVFVTFNFVALGLVFTLDPAMAEFLTQRMLEGG